jgi:hypothetical protein
VGVPLEEHDQNAMRKVHRSTPVSMVSNAVEIVVEN